MATHEKDTVAMPAADIPGEALPSPLPRRPTPHGMSAVPSADTPRQALVLDPFQQAVLDALDRQRGLLNALIASNDGVKLAVHALDQRVAANEAIEAGRHQTLVDEFAALKGRVAIVEEDVSLLKRTHPPAPIPPWPTLPLWSMVGVGATIALVFTYAVFLR